MKEIKQNTYPVNLIQWVEEYYLILFIFLLKQELCYTKQHIKYMQNNKQLICRTLIISKVCIEVRELFN